MTQRTFICLTLVFFFNFIVIYGASPDYCNRDLCKHKLHVACNNNGEINSACAANSEMLGISSKIKQIIVDKHNEYRNKLAQGKVPNFPPAKRMTTMRWSNELALMAELNVKSCTGTHDACHNTFNFKHSGQNIGRYSTKMDVISKDTLENHMYSAVDRWFQEHSKCPDKSLVYNNGKKGCGHFTVMIVDRNTHVGCAILLMKRKQTVFTCNYAYTNIRSKKLYSAGKTASRCKKGNNPKYPGLCAVNEIKNKP